MQIFDYFFAYSNYILIVLLFLDLIFCFLINLFGNINIFFFLQNNYKKYNSVFNEECYTFINGEQHKNNSQECFDHTRYRNYLSCHLGIAPSISQLGRVLVLGSAGKIGLSLVKLLTEKQIPYVEIRGRYQFDLNNSQIYEIFDTLNITHVFDLIRNTEGEKLHNFIYNYFGSKKIIVTRVVNDQIDSKFDQIISHEAFGNQYMRQDSSQIFKRTFNCIVKNKCDFFQFSEKKFYSLSHEISSELLNALFQKVPQIKKPSLKAYNQKQIWNKVLLFKKNKLPINDDFYQIFSEIDQKSIERITKPFLSIGYLTTNDEGHYSKAENTLKMYQKVLNEYPDISLEMTLFWVMKSNDTKFSDCIKFESELNFRLHVIEVSTDMIQMLMNVLNTKFIPEYYFRDVSLKLAKGEFLMTGSSDVYPSPAFFEIVQRKLVGPFTILKSQRIKAGSFDDCFSNYLVKQENVNSFLDNATNPCNFHYYFTNALGDLGDLQGAIRPTINALNGWIFNKFSYEVDAAFVWDLMMFRVPFYIVNMPKSMHKKHKFVSYLTPRFKISPKVKSGMFLCNAIPTKNMKDYIRKNWGVSFDFTFKKGEKKDGKFGHLLYNIICTENNGFFRRSRIEFRIVYNNDETKFN